MWVPLTVRTDTRPNDVRPLKSNSILHALDGMSSHEVENKEILFDMSVLCIQNAPRFVVSPTPLDLETCDAGSLLASHKCGGSCCIDKRLPLVESGLAPGCNGYLPLPEQTKFRVF